MQISILHSNLSRFFSPVHSISASEILPTVVSRWAPVHEQKIKWGFTFTNQTIPLSVTATKFVGFVRHLLFQSERSVSENVSVSRLVLSWVH
jgi:hypothetical protein